jgi:hypothetical protein
MLNFADVVTMGVGTSRWVVARRWSKRLREDYDVRIHPDYFREWRECFEKFGFTSVDLASPWLSFSGRSQ